MYLCMCDPLTIYDFMYGCIDVYMYDAGLDVWMDGWERPCTYLFIHMQVKQTL